MSVWVFGMEVTGGSVLYYLAVMVELLPFIHLRSTADAAMNGEVSCVEHLLIAESLE